MKRAKVRTSNKIKRAPGGRTVRMPVSPLSRLKPHMDVFELTAADEILAAFKMAAGLPVTRDPDLDIPLPPRADAADAHAATRVTLTSVQRQWRSDLRDTVYLRVADAVLFTETPLLEIDSSNRWRKGTARDFFATALKHFAYLRGNVPRGLRKDWKFNREGK